MEILLVIFGATCLVGVSVGVLYTMRILHNQEKRMEQEFEIKLASAKAQAMMKDNSTFEQIRNDIDYIISFYVIHEFAFITDRFKKEQDFREQLIEQFVSDISAKTLLSLSDEQIRQFNLYASIPEEDAEGEDFLTYFIRKETLTKAISRVEALKK